MAPAVHLREAVSLAGRFPLLSGLTLSVEEGEVVHLRGPNGAGKTSVLRLCAGLLRIASGSAEVLGYDLSVDRRSLRRQVHLLGHAGFLYDELTVEANVRFAVAAAHADPSRVLPSLERTGLTGRLLQTRAGALSLGQRRRCNLAVLLARSPRLWLLDEPHAGIDEAGRVLVDELIAEARKVGTSVLFSSHELDRAVAIADRSVHLAGGRVVEASPAATRPSAVPALLEGAGADVA